jgi:hypothetical protein
MISSVGGPVITVVSEPGGGLRLITSSVGGPLITVMSEPGGF